MTPVLVPRLASIDGRVCAAEDATIPATDEGLLRGDGAFEVFRVYSGAPFALDEHLVRLERSCRSLRLPFAPEPLTREIKALVAEAPAATYDLRVVLMRGGRRLLLLEPPVDIGTRLRVTLVRHSPSELLAGVKSLSYAAHMLATRIARERGFDEALFTTADGRVLEATTASLFWAGDDGILRTPPLTEPILASVTRRVLLSGLDVVETVCRASDLLSCREAFLASTVREVQGISAVEQHELAAPGPLTRLADETFRAEVARVVAAAGTRAAARRPRARAPAAVAAGASEEEVRP